MEESKTKVPEGELKIDASPMALLASIIQLNVRLRYIEEKNAFWDEIYRLFSL